MIKEFNKKNVLKFADYLYKEKNGWVHYQPMCAGVLKTEDYSTGLYMCCVMGEAYEFFFEKPVEMFHMDLTDDSVAELLMHISNVKDKNKTLLYNSLSELAYINDRNELEGVHVNDAEEVLIDRVKKCSKALKQIANKYLQ